MARIHVAGLVAVTSAAVLSSVLVGAAPEAERFWPQWRGPYANGVSRTADPPLEWSEAKNIRWKIEIPGRGSSSPIVWGDRLFVTTAIPMGVTGAATRALAGLSRGGAQTLNIGAKHLDLFSRLGVFSAAGNTNAETSDFTAKNASALNSKLTLFWLGMGTEYPSFANANRFSEFLKANGVKHTYRTIPGAHTWIVWRKFLNEMAPLLWQ